MQAPFVFTRLKRSEPKPRRQRRRLRFDFETATEVMWVIILPISLLFLFGTLIASGVTQATRTKWCADTYGEKYSYATNDGSGFCAIFQDNKEVKASETKEYKGKD